MFDQGRLWYKENIPEKKATIRVVGRSQGFFFSFITFLVLGQVQRGSWKCFLAGWVSLHLGLKLEWARPLLAAQPSPHFLTPTIEQCRAIWQFLLVRNPKLPQNDLHQIFCFLYYKVGKRRKNNGSQGVSKKKKFGVIPNQLSRPGAVRVLQDENLWLLSAGGQLAIQSEMLAVSQRR